MSTDASDEVAETETRPTVTVEGEETEPRPELVWDDEARGLCVRVYGDGWHQAHRSRLDPKQTFVADTAPSRRALCHTR
jgi:hypothetical protein